MIQIQFLAKGVGKPELLNPGHADNLVKAALPQFSDFIDQYPDNGRFFLLDQLEDNLMKSVWDMLEGKEIDASSMQQASAIIKLAAELSDEAAAKIDDLPSDLKAAPPTFIPG